MVGAHVASATGRLTVYLGDENFRRASWGLTSVHYIHGQSWLFEAVNVAGLHSFELLPETDHASYLAALLDAVRGRGPESQEAGAGEATQLCMLAVGPIESTLVTAKRDAVTVARAEVEGGRIHTIGLQSEVTAATATERLLQTVTG
jgi:hypothetical protein